jgi:hypothetical protein
LRVERVTITVTMANRIEPEDDGAEAALAYVVEPGKDGKEKGIIFVFRGTVEECRDLFNKLHEQTALCTGPEDRIEERRAKLVIMDVREDWENN